jgi:serine/threonine protein kinase/Flp pilus assembly protein TadD
VVEEYRALLRAGGSPDRPAFLARYPELAAALAECLDAVEFIEAAGPGLPSAAQAHAGAPPEADWQPSVPLGDYRIVREVGRGGMGVVYEAEQMSLGRRVALKVLPFASTLDPRQLQRFKNEAQAAAGLHHTHIVPVFATGCERGVHYYAMQFIDGQTVAALIAGLRAGPAAPPLSRADAPTGPDLPTPPLDAASTPPFVRGPAFFRTVAALGVQAAEALDHAHQLGVVHRDVKPANLLVDGRGELWVTDFGLAHCQSQAGLTLSGDLVGTLRYMSPEQALAKRVVVDHRTDVYSLGATLYELLTLEPAFAGTDRQELLRQIAFEEPRPPRRLNRAIPAELETIVLKAVEKEPARRYATAQELADDLRRFLEDRPIQARRPTLVQRARKWSRRHKAVVWSAAICSLLAVAAVGGSVGWVAGEGAARRAKAAEVFDEAVSRALVLMEEGNWPEAKAAAQRAGGLLAGAGGDELRRQLLSQVEADLKMVAKVELTRTQQAALKGEHFDNPGAAPAYAEAFRDYNLPVLELDADEAARRIAASAIRTELLATVGDWAIITQDPVARSKLRTVIALADRTPWKQQVFDAINHKDWAALARLAQEPETFRQPPARLVVLGNTLAEGDRPAAVKFLQQAQQRYPGDFWINHGLAEHLTRMKPPRLEEAIGYYRAALALRPQSPGARLNLGNALHARGRLAEAEAEFRAAVRLSPDYSGAHNNLGNVLRDRGLLDEAIAEHHEAIHLNKENYQAHTSLGNALMDKGLLDEAIAKHREAILLKKDFADAHNNLGTALRQKDRLDEAIAEHQAALRFNNESDSAHTNLGNALCQKGLLDEAIVEYRKALLLNEENYKAHNNLGVALYTKGRLDEAIAASSQAIRLKKDFPEAHYSLGLALGKTGRLDEAITAFKQAIHLKPDWADARHNLGYALQLKGRLDEAVAAFQEALRLKPGAANTRAALDTAREFLALDTRLGKVLSGDCQPANAAERAKLALLCAQPFKRLPATAARFYAEAFAVEPKLAEDLRAGHRYNAACAAALAGCGQGADADKLDTQERARLRQQALDWLRADLKAYRQVLEKSQGKAGPAIAERLQHWLQDNDFAGVRGADALARLPEGERQGWEKLWQESEALRQRAAQRPAAASSARP